MRAGIFTHSIRWRHAARRLFILTWFIAGFAAVKAQDSSSCTAQFFSSITQNQAFFRAVDSQSNLLHNWLFGDGTSSGFSSRYSAISHVYSNTGTYPVTHIIKDSLGQGCFDSVIQNIFINLPPACQISFQSVRDSSNFHVYSFFSTASNSSGAIDSIFWYVNDTLVGTGPNLLQHYFATGMYTICAKLTTSAGCQAEQCSQLTVSQLTSCGQPVAFSYTAGASNPQKLTFTPYPDSSRYRYQWNFGDGSTSTARTPTHLYAAGGVYIVALQVIRRTGRDSCISDTTESVFVTQKDTCKVGFTFKPKPKRANEISFVAENPQNLDSVTWILSRSSDSSILAVLSGKRVSYTFQDPGCYSMTMTALTRKGCVGSATTVVCIDSIQSGGNDFVASYPNPATSQVYVDLVLPADNTVRVSIFNLTGNNVQTNRIAGTKGANHIVIPTGSLPTGLYYVQLQAGNEMWKSKIQKL